MAATFARCHYPNPKVAESMSLLLTVRGLPVPQGSARAFIAAGRAFVATEGNRTSSPLGAWRSAVATEARKAMAEAPAWSDPVSVSITFFMPRPKSHRRTNGELRPSAPGFPAGKPDLDKLVRAVLDALSVVVFRDDAQVVSLTATKAYEGVLPVGALIRVDPAGGVS